MIVIIYSSMKKHQVALFIGRFQPFHNGHLYSLKKSLEVAETVKVVVAKSNVSGTPDDPWDYKIRKQMVCEVAHAQGILKRVAKICSCPDYPSDARWLSEIKKRAGQFDVVVSNNEWVLRVMREAGIPVYESGLYQRDELEGAKIREMMRRGDERWKLRVPKEVFGQIDVSAV